MARRNPSLDKSNKMLKGVLDGIDPLPNPMGVNHDALYQANEMPGHGATGVISNMTPNDGDNGTPPADPPFANGKDLRTPDTQGGADPTPSMPGC